MKQNEHVHNYDNERICFRHWLVNGDVIWYFNRRLRSENSSSVKFSDFRSFRAYCIIAYVKLFHDFISAWTTSEIKLFRDVDQVRSSHGTRWSSIEFETDWSSTESEIFYLCFTWDHSLTDWLNERKLPSQTMALNMSLAPELSQNSEIVCK